MTALVITLFAVALLAYVALPLLFPKQADPLPSLRDPELQDLEEERDALFRAIRELNERTDLDTERGSQLRARYEAKAARVLQAVDARQTALEGHSPGAVSTGRRRPPYATLTLLGIALVSAVVLGGFVLPRIGENATVTTFFEGDLEAARALRDLQRAADRLPTAATLGALADAYWQLGDAEQAEAIYLRLLAEVAPVPAVAYQRLGLLQLQGDLSEAARYLTLTRDAEPGDLDTLFTLGEVHFALGELEAAGEAWQAYLDQPAGHDEPLVIARLDLLDAVAPLTAAVAEEPSEDNLLALADAFWQREEHERAVELYFRVLTTLNPRSVRSLSRAGELLFLTGRSDAAVSLLDQARLVAAEDGALLEAGSLLFLGNALFSLDRFGHAVAVWEEYLMVAEEPGRVPDLIASARARLEQADDGAGDPSVAGRELFVARCASCHGAAGQGGSGPVLAGNRRAADADNVSSAIRFGRGAMPGFAGTLNDDEIALVTGYLVTELAPAEAP